MQWMNVYSYSDREYSGVDDKQCSFPAISTTAAQVFRAPLLWQIVGYLDGCDIKRLERLNRRCFECLNSRDDLLAVCPVLDLTYAERVDGDKELICRKRRLTYRNRPERCARIVTVGHPASGTRAGLGLRTLIVADPWHFLPQIAPTVERLFILGAELPKRETTFPKLTVLNVVRPAGTVPRIRWTIFAPNLRYLIASEHTYRCLDLRQTSKHLEFLRVDETGGGTNPYESSPWFTTPSHGEERYFLNLISSVLHLRRKNVTQQWPVTRNLLRKWIPPLTPTFWERVADLLAGDKTLLDVRKEVYTHWIQAAALHWDPADWTVMMIYQLRHIIGALWCLFESHLAKGLRLDAVSPPSITALGLGFRGCPTVPSDSEAFRFAFCCTEVPLILFPSDETQRHTFPHTPTPVLTQLECLSNLPLSKAPEADPYFPFRQWRWRQVGQKDSRTPILPFIAALDEEDQRVWRRVVLPYEEWERLLRCIPAHARGEEYTQLRRPPDADWVLYIGEMRRTSGQTLRRMLRVFHLSHVIVRESATNSTIAIWYYYGREAKNLGIRVRVLFGAFTYVHPVALDVLVNMAEGNYQPGQGKKMSAIESSVFADYHPVCEVNVIQFRYFTSVYTRLRRAIDLHMLADVKCTGNEQLTNYGARYDRLAEIIRRIMSPGNTMKNELWMKWGLDESIGQCCPEERVSNGIPLWRFINWQDVEQAGIWDPFQPGR